jgi:type VI protein secretion system component VasK
MTTQPANKSGDARTLGRQRLAERRRRLNRIRARVAGVAAALFVGSFAVIYAQAAPTAASTTAATKSTASSTSSASTSSASTSSAKTPVTTSQS